ncbi:MAG: archaemetzincin family Zn-dependent metalloprotease [Candidatus Krumholzibacteria bacterium]|nr:archaemetzincin family Zn-dependent metalloprotease [Candidatus Krumholzibacteria bacterium]
MAQRVYVVPIGEPPAEIVQTVVLRLAGLFSHVAVAQTVVPLGDAFDPVRRQCDSTRLLETLGREPPARGDRVIGVTDRDLFIPILTFVFGEAQLGGETAIVSLYRLRNEFYGLPPDPAAAIDRLVKECLHELGHTFGLVHCEDYGCVMHGSTSVEEIDLKGAKYCVQCAGRAAPWLDAAAWDQSL